MFANLMQKLTHMPDSYVIKNQNAAYFLTFQVVSWIDVFTRKRYRDIIVDAFNYCVENKSLQVHAWVIMSNHVHCILSSFNGFLSDTIRDFKKFTSLKILKSIQEEPESRKEWMLDQFRKAAAAHTRNTTYQFWTHESHAVEILPEIKGMAESKLFYIHDNPVRSGLVELPEEYLYSNGRDYAGKKGLIKLEKW